MNLLGNRHATMDVDRASIYITIISSELVHPYSHVKTVCLALFFSFSGNLSSWNATNFYILNKRSSENTVNDLCGADQYDSWKTSLEIAGQIFNWCKLAHLKPLPQL